MKTFRIYDRLPFSFLRPIAEKSGYDDGKSLWYFQEKHLKAVATSEFRPPKKGDLYLSGAEVEAYCALNDLTTPYRIARIVRVEEVKVEIIYEITDKLEVS